MIKTLKKAWEYFTNVILVKLAFALIVLLLVAILAGISYGVYRLLNLILAPIFSILITTIMMYQLIYHAVKRLTFPGSNWQCQRLMENYFRRQAVPNILRKVTELKNMVESIRLEKNLSFSLQSSDLENIAFTFNSVIKLFKKQATSNTLSKRQRQTMILFTNIQHSLEKIRVKDKSDDSAFTLWSFINGECREVAQKLNQRPGLTLSYESVAQEQLLRAQCETLEVALKEMIVKKPMFQNLKRWIYEDSFGSIDQMREEMEEVYKVKRISLHVAHNATLDCMLLHGHASLEKENQQVNQESQIDSNAPIMVFCQPNAGYYEMMLKDDEWTKFYLENGVNIFFWNYRGFGRSTGSPCPETLKRDGEYIIEYLRQELGFKKIGIHGESIGGLVATHVARAKNLDFLCADRTFSELSKIAELTYGRVAGALYKLITLWTDDTSNDYLEATCYKTLAFDPMDEVIHPLGSLKHGIIKKVLEKKVVKVQEPIKPMLKESYRIFSPMKLMASFKNLDYFMKKNKHKSLVNENLENYYGPLSKEETLALYRACFRVSEVIFMLMSETFENNARTPKLSTGKSSKGTATGASSSNGMKEEFNLEDSSSSQKVLSINLSTFETQNLLKVATRRSYVNLVEKNIGNQQKLEEFVQAIATIFEELEAGGIQLIDVMSAEDSCYMLFRHFIHSFEVWGSFHPIDQIFTDEVTPQNLYFHNSINALESFIQEIDNLTASYQTETNGNNKENIFSLIIQDLSTISSIMAVLKQNLKTKDQTEHASSFSPDSSPPMTFQEAKNSKRSLGDRLIEIELNLQGTSSLGHLIPLTCGHNGIPHYMEMEVFRFHLKNSNLLR